MGSDTQETRRIKTSETTFDVIESLHELNGAGVTELAEYLGRAPSTVHEHLTTLADRKYVVKEGDTYHLSLTFLHLGTHVKYSRTIAHVVEPVLETVAEESGEVAWFNVEEHGDGVIVEHVTSDSGVRVRHERGERFPLCTTASGRAILAHLPEHRRERIIEDASLEGSIDETELQSRLELVRTDEIAFNKTGLIDDVRAVATPLQFEDRVYGALCVSGPDRRLTEDRVHSDLAEILTRASNEIRVKLAKLSSDQYQDPLP